jgi:hypothetical protein
VGETQTDRHRCGIPWSSANSGRSGSPSYSRSVLGDQLVRVSLAVLLFDRTNSPAWPALTYALTFLPDLVSGHLLTDWRIVSCGARSWSQHTASV